MTHEHEPPERPSETTRVRVRYFDRDMGEYQEKLVTEAEEFEDFRHSLGGGEREYRKVDERRY